MPFSRRTFLAAVGGTVLIPAGSACSGSSDHDGGGNGDNVVRSTARLPPPFSVPLRVPPVLRPARSDATTDYYEITARAANVEILPGLHTEVWGYDGLFPGPTIEARSGRRVVIGTRNETPVPIVTHLHGGRTPPESDGYPTDLILPTSGWSARHGQHAGDVTEGTREYVYPLRQRAATLWYHDHRMDFTGPQVWQGLAGFHLLRDEEDDALPLPKGDREIPLMITDRSFAEDGSMPYPSLDPELRDTPGVDPQFHNGVLGDVILVNGVPWPFLEVAAVRYRLRLLNASNARRYRIYLDPPPQRGDGEPFAQVGSDGGLLAGPHGLDSIYMTPAERFDVVIDFGRYRPGTVVTMRNRLDGGGAGQIMQFVVTGPAVDDARVPERLSDVETLDPASATRTREFAFTATKKDGRTVHGVNDLAFTTDFVAADPRLGATEIWSLRTSNNHHPIHLHLAHFQILGSGGEMREEDRGWKDTVRLEPNKEVQIVVRFDGYPGKYVFHCHNLEHEDMAMMANFQVV
jgi:spore coat protein A